MVDEKCLWNLKEFCSYVGIGATKAREIVRSPSCPYSLRIGNRWYINRKKFEKWLECQ